MADPLKSCECHSRELAGPRRSSAVRECRGSGCWFKVALCDDAASFNFSLTAVRLVFSSADGARSRISPASDAAVSVTPGKRTVHSLQTFATNERFGHFTAKPDRDTKRGVLRGRRLALTHAMGALLQAVGWRSAWVKNA